MNKVSLRLICPKCHLDGNALVKESYKNCLVFICPKCESTVVCYDNKVDIISSELLQKLVKRGQLKFCGKARFISKKSPKSSKKSLFNEVTAITEDDLLNLKIILETEKDSSRIISLL